MSNTDNEWIKCNDLNDAIYEHLSSKGIPRSYIDHLHKSGRIKVDCIPDIFNTVEWHYLIMLDNKLIFTVVADNAFRGSTCRFVDADSVNYDEIIRNIKTISVTKIKVITSDDDRIFERDLDSFIMYRDIVNIEFQTYVGSNNRNYNKALVIYKEEIYE